MPIKFRDESEFAKVDAGRKRAGRPSFFNADTGLDQEISADFEAVLILLPATTKAEARQKFDAQSQPVERIQKRDAVLAAALAIDAENATAQMSELQQEIEQLQNFKAAFSKYAEVGEIGLLLRDAQLDMDETVARFEQAQNLKTVTNVLNEKLQNNGITDDLNQERQSWSRVLTEYGS